jgi:DNA-binding beta-propeller fold protein YncE
MKYGCEGNELWYISHEQEWLYHDWGDVLALDPQGNVCVAIGNHRVAKYDTNGNEIWMSSYNNSPDGYGEAHAVAVDGLSNIFVVGSLATVKYTGDGAFLWAGDGGEDIAVDNMGNAYVIGEDDRWCIATKYNTDGVEVWTARYWGGLGEGDLPYGIDLDASGNVYITGESIYKICPIPFGFDQTEVVYSEYITIKYSQQ